MRFKYELTERVKSDTFIGRNKGIYAEKMVTLTQTSKIVMLNHQKTQK